MNPLASNAAIDTDRLSDCAARSLIPVDLGPPMPSTIVVAMIYYQYSSLARATPILAEFGITASPSRLYNEVLDDFHRARGLETPQRRVRLAPRVVIRRIDKE